jgi:hypothetical protein
MRYLLTLLLAALIPLSSLAQGTGSTTNRRPPAKQRTLAQANAKMAAKAKKAKKAAKAKKGKRAKRTRKHSSFLKK